MRTAWTSTARDTVADPTREGWAALALCVIMGVGCERAFELLTDHNAPPMQLTEQDYRDVELLRAQGHTWGEISRIYGRQERTAMHKAYTRYIKKREVKDYEGSKHAELNVRTRNT